MSEENLCKQILDLFSSNDDVHAKDIVKELKQPKADINRELYSLAKDGILKKVKEIPPMWRRIDTKPFENSVQPETFISVFWDIENCSVPKNKSAVDIVDKIRHTYSNDHTEENFYVACDTKNLPEYISKELSESGVTVVNADSNFKNAADQELKKLMQKFQQRHRNKDCAIVLLSGDSDFSTDLTEMRYSHHIFVNLLYKGSRTREALKKAANHFIDYEDFIKDLPDRKEKERWQSTLLLSNFPHLAHNKRMKQLVLDKIKSTNGTIEIQDGEQLEMLIKFSNDAKRQKAKVLLENFEIDGYEIKVVQFDLPAIQNSMTLTKNENMPVIQPSKVSNGATGQNLTNIPKKDSKLIKDAKRSDMLNVVDDGKQNVRVKKSSLLLSVAINIGDVFYWQTKIEQILENCCKNMTVTTSDKENTKNIISVEFESTSQAKKAKKVLMEQQKPDSFKFLTLVEDSNCLNDAIS